MNGRMRELENKDHGLFKTTHHHLHTHTDENHEQPLSKIKPMALSYHTKQDY
jgi:hypothetical protein